MLLYRGVTMLYGFWAWQAFSKSASCRNRSGGTSVLNGKSFADARLQLVDFPESLKLMNAGLCDAQAKPNTAQHNSAQHSSTAQHRTAQHSTA